MRLFWALLYMRIVIYSIWSSGKDLAPVPQTIFRSNSKLHQNLKCYGLKYSIPITTKFRTRHNIVNFVCKISLRSVKYILNQSTGNFGRISNAIEILLVWRSPSPVYCQKGGPANASKSLFACSRWCMEKSRRALDPMYRLKGGPINASKSLFACSRWYMARASCV